MWYKMANILDLSHSSLPFCDVMTPVTLFPEEQQELERALLTVLHSNVRSLLQAYGELYKTCSTPSYDDLFNRDLFMTGCY